MAKKKRRRPNPFLRKGKLYEVIRYGRCYDVPWTGGRGYNLNPGDILLFLRKQKPEYGAGSRRCVFLWKDKVVDAGIGAYPDFFLKRVGK